MGPDIVLNYLLFLAYSVGVANGRPCDGTVAQIMRKTRISYHAKVRRIMREEQTKIENLIQCFLSNESEDLWQEIKRLRGTNKLPSIVQSETTSYDIALLFQDILKLFTC